MSCVIKVRVSFNMNVLFFVYGSYFHGDYIKQNDVKKCWDWIRRLALKISFQKKGRNSSCMRANLKDQPVYRKRNLTLRHSFLLSQLRFCLKEMNSLNDIWINNKNVTFEQEQVVPPQKIIQICFILQKDKKAKMAPKGPPPQNKWG